ncbi:MAG: hypothetical protein HYY84_03075 [Deltaproteobacteria bacterium]|nr:hypothetical protein [Deltaproteobacteria bacterium]
MNRSDDWNRPADDEERAAAERLAKALDGRAVESAGIEAELEVAALVRAAAMSAELTRERSDAVWARIAEGDAVAGAGPGAGVRAVVATRVRAPVARRRGVHRWLWGAAGAAATAAVVMLVTSVTTDRGTKLPPPNVSLVKAQAQAASRGAGISPLGREMRVYRERMLVAISATAEEPR